MVQGTPFESRLFRLCMFASLPSCTLLLSLMIYEGYSIYLTLLASFFFLSSIVYCAWAIREKVSGQFHSITNLLEALSNGDFGLRGRDASDDSTLGELISQLNNLAKVLGKQRLEVKEGQLLLAKIINHIDVGIISIDGGDEITLINQYAADLLDKKVEDMHGKRISNSSLLKLFSCQDEIINWQFATKNGQFRVYNDQFIEDGKSHKIVFISYVQDILRAEERKTWQNLVRVLSHEINNSLAPITSLSQTLGGLVHTENLPREAVDKNLIDGLALIGERSLSLKKFVDSYKHFSHLPKPSKSVFSLSQLATSLQLLYPGADINILTQKDINISADKTQFEQVLINLGKNALEAAGAAAKLTISWYIQGKSIHLCVQDNGPGLHNLDNLFVPFYTTKREGSGIGLVLCRQIIEAHGGSLQLENVVSGGCLVTVKLPIDALSSIKNERV